MKKFFKRFFLYLLLFLIVVIGLGVGAIALFEDQIGERLVGVVNNNIATELRVDEVKLSLFSAFPRAAVHLNRVQLQDSQGGLLLEAEKVAFKFGLLGLIRSNYQIQSVTLSNGGIRVRINEAGQPNYHIFTTDTIQTTTDTIGKRHLNISLNEAVVSNMELIFEDEQQGAYVATTFLEGRFTGDFNPRAFTLKSDGQMENRFIELAQERYLAGKNIRYDADIFVNLKEQTYEIQKLALDVEANELLLDGKIEVWNNGLHYDLKMHTGDGQVGSVLQLLPQSYQKYLSDFESKGKFEFLGVIKGLENKEQNPNFTATLSLREGTLSSPRLTSDLKDVSFDAYYDNGKFRTSESSRFELENFSGYFNRELIELELIVRNFQDPKINFTCDGVIPLNSVYQLLNNPAVTSGSGELEVKNLQLAGDYDDMIDTRRIARVEASGAIEFDDAALTVNGEKVILDRGELIVDDNQLVIKELKLEGAGSEIRFEGEAYNLIPVLFADSLNSQRSELEFQAKLESPQLDIDRLMKLSALSQAIAESKDSAIIDSLRTLRIKQRERLTNFLKGTFDARVDNFNYQKIEGENFTGQLSFDNNQMGLIGSTYAMKGIATIDGNVFFERRPQLSAQIVCENIDATTFFEQTNNFGQSTVTSQNLEGKLNSQMVIRALWSPEGRFLEEDLEVLARLEVVEGELKNLDLMEQFSNYVKIKDLQRIKFAKLENVLEVRREVFYLPIMFVRSNALNLTVNGEQSFDNEFRYNIKVNAGQVLTNRFKKYDPSLSPKPARRNGFFNLYYEISGTPDDYEVRTAKRQIKSEFERSQVRKDEIRQALQEAFGKSADVAEPSSMQDEAGSAREEQPEKEEENEVLDFEVEGGAAKDTTTIDD